MESPLFACVPTERRGDWTFGRSRWSRCGERQLVLFAACARAARRLAVPLSPSEAAERELPTFLVYNMRRKVTSSAKKKREPGSTRISQTPDGSFYDLQRNAWHLLQQCNVKQVPEGGSVEQYLQDGPGFIFLFHPALGARTRAPSVDAPSRASPTLWRRDLASQSTRAPGGASL